MLERPDYPLQAATRIVLASPQAIMQQLCEHFVEHCEVTEVGGRARFDAAFGSALLECDGDSLCVEAFGFDDSTLTFVKMAVAEHVLEFAAPEAPRIVWSGDGPSTGALPYFRELRVTGVRDVTPRMRRVSFAGDNLAGFTVGGLHVRVLFPPKGRTPVWPVMGEDGRPVWAGGPDKLMARIYTIRRIDPAKGELDIDFVMHEGDKYPGAGFAAKAQAGDIVGMTGPGGGELPPVDWYLLAGDETALPAIGRILQELPATAHAVVRIEVQDAAEEQALTSAAALDLAWLHRGEAEAGTTALLENAVRAVDIPKDGRSIYAWAGCEHKTFRAIRKFLRGERGLTRSQHVIAAYWRRGFDGDSPEAGEA
jgi:NADPH-dependent ferric siderophore reductase